MREIKFRAWNEKFSVMYDWQIILDSIKVERMLEGLPGVTVMQYTGLKDKNGVEIYEGDIVNVVDDRTVFDDYPYVIVWDAPVFCLERRDGSGRSFYPQVEVIGNIYENPELLGAPTKPTTDHLKHNNERTS